jgi:hypothetical protein
MSRDPTDRHDVPNLPEDMVFCPPSPEAVGLPQRSLDEVIELISALPFGPSMRAMSMLAAELHHHASNPLQQAKLATSIYREPIASGVLRFRRGGAGWLAFDLRHVTSRRCSDCSSFMPPRTKASAICRPRRSSPWEKPCSISATRSSAASADRLVPHNVQRALPVSALTPLVKAKQLDGEVVREL